MNFYYTRNIRRRIRQRELLARLIEEAVTNPDHAEAGFRGRHLAQKTFHGKILEVVYREEIDRMILITAYWLRGRS